MAYRKIWAIPDIHGRVDLLDKALGMITDDGYDLEQDMVVFLGDFIDRGPDSKAVVAKVQHLVESGLARAVSGNHESFAIEYYMGRGDMELWLYNGGTATLLSYSRVPGRPGTMSDEHVKFLASLPRSIEFDGFFFSHAPVPRQCKRKGRGPKLDGSNNTAVGKQYSLNELTWTYFGIECEKPDAMMGVHEGPLENGGVGPGHLYGVCGHIHRGPYHQNVRLFPNYAMLDVGAGCFPNSPLALFECHTKRVMYAYPDKPYGTLNLNEAY